MWKILIFYSVTLIHAQSQNYSIEFDPQNENYDQMISDYLKPYLDPDEDSFMFQTSMRSGSSQKNVRRLKQLKTMIISAMSPDLKDPNKNPYLNGGKGFGRYCFYGCHCLPDAEHLQTGPKPGGKPVDEIDETCRQFGTCYKCLKNKHNAECKPEETHYRFKIVKDEKTGDVKDIICLDKKDRCKQDVCQCDRKFALDVRKVESVWEPSNHMVKGNFNREKQCPKSPSKGKTPDGCCGKIPNVSIRRQDEKCCGSKSYDDEKKECCNPKTSEILKRGTC